jgi:hypothetical protein
VQFLVAGFHQVVVYKPGTKPDDIVVRAAGTFINDPTNEFYYGINPAGGPRNTQATRLTPSLPAATPGLTPEIVWNPWDFPLHRV